MLFTEEIATQCSVAVWVGPSHVRFIAGSCCIVIGSEDIGTTKRVRRPLQRSVATITVRT